MTLRYESKAEEDARTHLFLNHLLLQLCKLRASCVRSRPLPWRCDTKAKLKKTHAHTWS